jgi:signal transduction histidine kinase
VDETGRVTRIADRAAPWVLGVLLSMFVLLDYSPRWQPAARDIAIILFAAAAGVTAGMAHHRLWPLLAVTAAGSLLFSWWPAFIVASYYAATTLRRGGRVVLFTAASAGVLLVVPTLHDLFDTDYLLGPEGPISFGERVFLVLLLVGLPLAIGLWINARRQVIASLAERAERLEREQAAQVERARAAERTRIAREMHDAVAHQVSLMVVHAGALEVDAPDQGTRHTAELIRSTGRQALTSLRQVLHVLRTPVAEPPAPPPALDDLDRLLQQSRTAGLPVRRTDHGVVRPVPAAAQYAAYRVVQEALTNVHKHAAGAVTEVTVRYRPGDLEVTVHNVRPATGQAPHKLPGSGLGLAGLGERLHLIGGDFGAGPGPDGGFTVTARIPTAGGLP